MNRKNLTAAVLAGLAGAAGLAGTAQAVNLNPDGLGQVLIYPYYTTNGGNQTILSVVNTTDQAKAVKVRFLEGYNSREVLDFNLYMSHHDVWVAAIADNNGTPTLYVPDTSCTVPYLYGDAVAAGGTMGVQPFLPYAFTGKFDDGGPTTISRAAEGYFEMIEMGVLTDASARAATVSLPKRVGSATAATHVLVNGESVPANCAQLVRNWTLYGGAKPDPLDGMWRDESGPAGQASIDTTRNRGGLFGGASIVNTTNGTMFSYDAKAIQGYDKTSDGVHYVPGTINPSLNSGNQRVANIFFGTPTNEAVALPYGAGVDAISALFMHDNLMNTFTIQEDLAAETEWVFTFPTKAWYVDSSLVGTTSFWEPNPDDAGCNGWDPGEPFPSWYGTGPKDTGWEQCEYLEYEFTNVRPPFTEEFDGEACEIVDFHDWDREESPSTPGTPGNTPPIVSPPPPPGPKPPGVTPFALCYEVNRLAFGADSDIFGDSGLESVVSGTADRGWANINFSLPGKFNNRTIELHQDRNGLVGLPVTGFAAEEYENEFLGGGSVQAFYGGTYQHKGSVRRIRPDAEYHGRD